VRSSPGSHPRGTTCSSSDRKARRTTRASGSRGRRSSAEPDDRRSAARSRIRALVFEISRATDPSLPLAGEITLDDVELIRPVGSAFPLARFDEDIGNAWPASSPRAVARYRLLEGWFELTPGWRRYRIPCSELPDIDFRTLVRIRFIMGTDLGNAVGTTLYLDDIGRD
jgi:hypothetical protein